MKTGVKSVIKILAFICILAAILLSINEVLIPKYFLSNTVWPTTATYNSFYALKNNTIDVLFIGSSYCVNGLSPQEIYNQYGIRSFNLGSQEQSVFLSYYWLKEALNYQSPSVVVLEGRFFRPFHPHNPIKTPEGLIRKCLDPMRLSLVKIEAVNDLCSRDSSQIKSSWYLTNIRFHDRWKSLGEIDFDNSEIYYSHLMGWAPGNGELLDEFNPLVVSDDEKLYQFDDLTVEYFQKMAELCQRNGITFVVINVPASGMNSSIYQAYKKICEENGVDYIDLTKKEEWDELGIELSRDNPVGHGNIWGNIKTSRYVGKILYERYNVPQINDSQFEENKGFYEHIKSSFRLREVTDVDEYLCLLNDNRYCVFISVKGDAAKTLKETTKTRLKELGFGKEWDAETDYRKSYIGIITDEGVMEKTDGVIKITGRFRDRNNSFSVISRGYKDKGGSYSSIVIDGEEKSVNERGLNIVVYDTVRRIVVDSVSFDTNADSSVRR